MLEVCRDRGIDPVLVTCDVDNVGVDGATGSTVRGTPYFTGVTMTPIGEPPPPLPLSMVIAIPLRACRRAASVEIQSAPCRTDRA